MANARLRLAMANKALLHIKKGVIYDYFVDYPFMLLK